MKSIESLLALLVCLVLTGCIRARDDSYRPIDPPPPAPIATPTTKPPVTGEDQGENHKGNPNQDAAKGGADSADGKGDNKEKDKGNAVVKSLTVEQLNQLPLSDIGTALKENRTNRFDAARQVRKRLLEQKGIASLPQVHLIAESVLSWISPEHPEAMQEILESLHPTRTFGELMDVLSRRDEFRYDSFIDAFQTAHKKGLKTLPSTKFFEESKYILEREQTQHLDAFFLHWILSVQKSTNRALDSGSTEVLKKYLSVRIKHQINELILARNLAGESSQQFVGMAPSALLWTFVAEGAVSQQAGQEFYAIQRELPAPFVEEMNRLFLQYQEVLPVLEPIGEGAPLWVLNQFQFLLHGMSLADLKDFPQAREVFCRLIQTWLHFPSLNRDPKAVRLPLSDRVWNHIRTEFALRLDAAKNASPALASQTALVESRLNLWVDLVNTLFDSDLKSLGTGSTLTEVGRNSVRGQGESRFEQLVRWSDERFFGVLAPYWQWQIAHPELNRWPEHPLSRLYFYRAKLASAVQGAAGSPYWAWIRDFTQVPVSADVDGKLFKREGFPAIKLSPAGRTHEALDLSLEVLNHDLRHFEQEIRKVRADLKTVDVAAELTPQLAQVSEYLWSLNTVEVIRMLLDEDRARKFNQNPSRDFTVRPGEASLRMGLVSEALKALQIRFGQVPQMLPVSSLFPGMADLLAPHAATDGPLAARIDVSGVTGVVSTGMSLRFENTHQHFNGAPGVFELSQNTELKFRSAFFHPLSVLFGSTEYRLKSRWLRNGGWSPHRYLTYQPGVDVEGPPHTLDVSVGDQSAVLNDPETALANYLDTVPMVAGPQVRKVCKADLFGFRPQTYDPTLPLGRQIIPPDAPAADFRAQFGSLVERYNLPEWR